jgi:hypothetical protein
MQRPITAVGISGAVANMKIPETVEVKMTAGTRLSNVDGDI